MQCMYIVIVKEKCNYRYRNITTYIAFIAQGKQIKVGVSS